MATTMRVLVPVALLWQVATNVFQVEATSSSSSTTYTELILRECSVEIDACGADSGCAPCLAGVQGADLPTGPTTSGADCTSSYASVCDVLQSAGCDMENAFVDDLAACAAGVTLAACNGFESCSVYLSGVPTVTPTSSPTPTSPTSSATPTASPSSTDDSTTMTAVPTSSPTSLTSSATPTASPSSTDDSTTMTVVPTSSPTSTFHTQIPSVGPTATPTLSLSSMPTASPTVSSSSTPTATPTAFISSAPTMTPTASPSSMPTMTPTASPSSVHNVTLAPTSSPTSTTPTPTIPAPVLQPAVIPSTELPISSPVSGGLPPVDDTSGASRRLQGVWSTASFCFSLAYYIVARAAYTA